MRTEEIDAKGRRIEMTGVKRGFLTRGTRDCTLMTVDELSSASNDTTEG
jgi:hypothetical protein